MGMNNAVMIAGNLAADPRLFFSDAGDPRAVMTIFVSISKDRSIKMSVTAFGSLAENVAGSVGKGNRVIVTGRLDQYEKPIAGEDYPALITTIVADSVAPDLLWATVGGVEKNARNQDGGGSQQRGGAGPQRGGNQAPDGWGGGQDNGWASQGPAPDPYDNGDAWGGGQQQVSPAAQRPPHGDNGGGQQRSRSRGAGHSRSGNDRFN